MKKIILILILFITSPVFAATNIPKVHITGNILYMNDKSDVRKVEIKYESKDVNFSSYATLKIQGTFSLNYPKKNYNVRFYNDEECKDKRIIDLGWGKLNKYVLKANWIDPTHSRNIVGEQIAGDINKKYGYFKNTINNGAIDGYAVEVYVNDYFHGLYTLNLAKDYMFEEAEKKDYLLISSKDNFWGFEGKTQETENWEYFEVEVGEENQENLEKFNRLLKFLTTSTPEEFKENINNYIDLNSMINYYCYLRYADLVDNGDNNIYFLTYDGNYWYMVFYDLDTSFGYNWDYNYTKLRQELYDNIKMWDNLETVFPDHIVVRYNELRQDIFTTKNIMSKFNDFYNTIPKEVLANEHEMWPDVDRFQIENIEKFLTVHTPLLDEHINTFKTSEFEKVKKEFGIFNESQKENKSSKLTIIVIMSIIPIFIVLTIIIVIVIKKKKTDCIRNEEVIIQDTTLNQ